MSRFSSRARLAASAALAGVLTLGVVSPALATERFPQGLPTPQGATELEKESIAVVPPYSGSGGVKRYWDVPRTHKFYQQIMWLSESGITNGYADGGFYPGDRLTREAMAAFLYRQAGSPKFTMPTTGFADVTPTDRFYRPVMWMKANGYAAGYQNGRGQLVFGAKEKLTREAMAAFLYRVAGRPAAKAGNSFADVRTSTKFSKEIGWMKSAKLTTGYADGRFGPKDRLSREAMAAFLYRQAGSPSWVDSGTVSVTGEARVGQELTASVSGWASKTDIAYSYQWLRSGIPITGATDRTYVATDIDAYQQVQARVVGKVASGHSVAVTSWSVLVDP